MKTGKSYTSEF